MPAESVFVLFAQEALSRHLPNESVNEGTHGVRILNPALTQLLNLEQNELESKYLTIYNIYMLKYYQR